jgi:hypothetical protein
MRKLCMAVALALGLGGCPSDPGSILVESHPVLSWPVPWQASCDLPERLVEDVAMGLRLWEEATGREMFRRLPGCLEAGEGMRGGILAYETPYPQEGTAASATRTTGGGAVVLHSWRSYPDVMRQAIVAHEVGHLLGLGHVPEPDCVMGDGWSPCPAEVDHALALMPGEE